VVEQGSHEILIEKNDSYAAMYNAGLNE